MYNEGGQIVSSLRDGLRIRILVSISLLRQFKKMLRKWINLKNENLS